MVGVDYVAAAFGEDHLEVPVAQICNREEWFVEQRYHQRLNVCWPGERELEDPFAYGLDCRLIGKVDQSGVFLKVDHPQALSWSILNQG